jgi:hypothetical protein
VTFEITPSPDIADQDIYGFVPGYSHDGVHVRASIDGGGYEPSSEAVGAEFGWIRPGGEGRLLHYHSRDIVLQAVFHHTIALPDAAEDDA